jgi:hypothetical protein
VHQREQVKVLGSLQHSTMAAEKMLREMMGRLEALKQIRAQLPKE